MTRIPLKRTKGWRLPPDAKSVAYPTRWQNPYRKVHPRIESLRLFREHLDEHPESEAQATRELAGQSLACWYGPDERCHADIWLEIVNRKIGSEPPAEN